MFLLFTGLSACRLAQGLGVADRLVLDALLRERRAPFIRIPVGSLVFDKPCLELLYYLVPLAQICIEPVYIAVQLAYIRVLRDNRLVHQPRLVQQGLQYIRYVQNLLIHRYKNTKSV